MTQSIIIDENKYTMYGCIRCQIVKLKVVNSYFKKPSSNEIQSNTKHTIFIITETLVMINEYNKKT